MLTSLFFLLTLGVAVVFLTRLLVSGIEIFAATGVLSAKSKGQLLGYATSMPELAGTVGTAGNGLLGAGLWNVAASNIINVALFVSAALYFGRLRHAWRRKFADEIGFSLAAFALPLLLVQHTGIAKSPYAALGLFACFLVYVYVDKRLNPESPPSITMGRIPKAKSGTLRGFLLIGVGLVGIVLAANQLGTVAKTVVHDLGVPEWAVGWILGVITSLPEMTAFFAVFASAQPDGESPIDDTDCQENLDSLAASNMSNLTIVYPIGIAVFLLLGHR